jgi:hypothetical protein
VTGATSLPHAPPADRTVLKKIVRKNSKRTRTPQFGNFAFSFSRQFARHQIDTTHAQCSVAARRDDPETRMTTRTKATKTTIATPTLTPVVSPAKPIAPKAVAPKAGASRKSPVKTVAAPAVTPAPSAVVIPMPLKPAVKTTQASPAGKPLAKTKAKRAPQAAAGRTTVRTPASATTAKRAAAPTARKASLKPVAGKLKVAAAAVKPAGKVARKKK